MLNNMKTTSLSDELAAIATSAKTRPTVTKSEIQADLDDKLAKFSSVYEQYYNILNQPAFFDAITASLKESTRQYPDAEGWSFTEFTLNWLAARSFGPKDATEQAAVIRTCINVVNDHFGKTNPRRLRNLFRRKGIRAEEYRYTSPGERLQNIERIGINIYR